MATNKQGAALSICSFTGCNGHSSSPLDAGMNAPGLVVNRDRLVQVLETLDGALSIAVLDYEQPWRSVAADGDFVVTSPLAAAHPFQLYEDRMVVYVVIEGSATLEVKPQTIGKQVVILSGETGDILVAPVGLLHRLRWCSNEGLSYVFRLPSAPSSARNFESSQSGLGKPGPATLRNGEGTAFPQAPICCPDASSEFRVVLTLVMTET